MNFKIISWGVLFLSLFLAATVFGGEYARYVVYLIGCWTVGGWTYDLSRRLAERF